jgi:hypothetical protein
MSERLYYCPDCAEHRSDTGQYCPDCGRVMRLA